MTNINGLRLFAEMSANTPITEPTTPLGKDDEVIGVVPEGLRQLQCYLGQISDEATRAVDAIKKEIQEEKEAHQRLHLDPDCVDEKCDEHGDKILALLKSLRQIENTKVAQAKAVHTVFWTLLRLELDMAGEGDLTIHTGWAVSVIRESEEDSEEGLQLLQHLFTSLFGR